MKHGSPTGRASTLFRYGVGVIMPVVSAGATWLAWQWLQPAVSLLFFPAVTIAALYGGLGPSLAATALSVVLAAFFYIPPMYSLSIGMDDVARLVIFSTGAVITASLSAGRERAESKLRRANVELQTALDDLTDLTEGLERRVGERTAELEHSNDALQVEIAERRKLAEQLVRAEEGERRRLARELHDQVGQVLTALKLMLEAIARRTQGAERDTTTALELVETLMGQIREISLDLRPSMLDDLGLLPALLWHFDRYTVQTGLTVSFTQSGLEERLASDMETAAFRIVQEALTNVARHAGVRDAAVWLRQSDGELCVIVEDTGRGFLHDATTPVRSSGLSGMRERAMLLGGTLGIHTSVAGGTRITAVFPLPGLVARTA